jgi:hypothetical protein
MRKMTPLLLQVNCETQSTLSLINVLVNLKSESRVNALAGRVLHREVSHFSEVANRDPNTLKMGRDWPLVPTTRPE